MSSLSIFSFLSFFLFTLLTFPSCFASVQTSSSSNYFSHRILEIHHQERAPPPVQEKAALAVLARLLPSHLSSFSFQIVSKESCGGQTCFIINNHPSFGRNGAPQILIQGVSGVELSAGLHWYLKHQCHAHISWEKTGGVQLFSVPKPGSLPRVNRNGVLIQRPIPWNYYQNAVTSSYTFAWWDWERWENEIDWMALQGINLPLAFNGQEAIWQKVFRRFNISDEELGDFFGGPAFLAWSRMANLHGWGGPLPQNWLDGQLLLQKKILRRMHELGMSPVLPAFSGNVPAALKSKFPSAKITRLGNWFTVNNNPNWSCNYLLDATDPLFVEIGKTFIEEQLKEYGRTSHIYNCDTFDENTPPVNGPNYISSLGAAIYQGIESGDKDAVWLMQGWLFSYDPFWEPPQMKALLHSVPIGRMIVLDLYAEVKPVWKTSQQFYGIPYIWCMLHNFAGNLEMYGILDSVVSGPIDALTSENSTMIGVGMCMEGIEQNPVVYDLMSEMAFQHEKINAKQWLDVYPRRRYGKHILSIQQAWEILHRTLYNCTDGANDKNRDVIVAFPDVDPSMILTPATINIATRPQIDSSKGASFRGVDDTYDKPHLWYSTSDVIYALELFLSCRDELSNSNTFKYDLVDLTRQALAKYANQVFLRVIEAYKENDFKKASTYSDLFLSTVSDMDVLLASHDGFLLGPWLESAKSLAKNSEEEKQYEWNARTQITMWFDNTETEASLLRDYGNKYWSGLLVDYYKPRAEIYFKYLLESMEKGEEFALEDWRREWISLTNNWQNSRKSYSVKASGDALNISQYLYVKYLQSSDSYSVYSLYASF